MVYVHVPSLVCVLSLTWTWHYSYRNNVLQWFKVGTLKNILTFYRASTYRDAESWSFFYNCIWMVSKCSNIWMVSKCSNVINRPLLKKICFIVERRALCKFIELKKKDLLNYANSCTHIKHKWIFGAVFNLQSAYAMEV